MKFLKIFLKYVRKFFVAEIDEEMLWDLVFNGRPLSATFALTILNQKYEGKILSALRRNEQEIK